MVVEKFSSCFSVLAVFQQTELQWLAHNFSYDRLIMLKIGEHLDHKIHDNIGIQNTAQKCKEIEIKIPTSFCSDTLAAC